MACPSQAGTSLSGDNWHLKTFTPGLLPCLYFSLLLCAPPSRVDAGTGFAFFVSYLFISESPREAAPAREGTSHLGMFSTPAGSSLGLFQKPSSALVLGEFLSASLGM